MAKKHLEDRLLSREDALSNLKQMLSEPCIKSIVKHDTVIGDATAKRLGDLLIYTNGIKEYIKPQIDKYLEAKLFILSEVFKNYMKGRLN
ncbi:MAG: hypothetical protein WC852_04070 [Candidatus Nanoarchaeia archaeon]|jgi:hypothetical protein